jgi:Ca2+ transporting ATPase
MTLFNEINSRKLHGERNVFKGIFRNPFFYCIWIFSFGLQILIVTFGGQIFSCARLNIIQWGWSLLFGFGSLIWQQFLLFIPTKPIERCLSAICCVRCLRCCKKQARECTEEEDHRETHELDTIRRPPRTSDDDYLGETFPLLPKKGTLGHRNVFVAK